jgi:hypothetical protein
MNFFIISPLSFCVESKFGSVVSEQVVLDHFFQCMSPTNYEYRKLGLKIVSLEHNLSRTPKKPSMVKEKKKRWSRRSYQSVA